jgi:hypothetical protein
LPEATEDLVADLGGKEDGEELEQDRGDVIHRRANSTSKNTQEATRLRSLHLAPWVRMRRSPAARVPASTEPRTTGQVYPTRPARMIGAMAAHLHP